MTIGFITFSFSLTPSFALDNYSILSVANRRSRKESSPHFLGYGEEDARLHVYVAMSEIAKGSSISQEQRYCRMSVVLNRTRIRSGLDICSVLLL